MLKFQFRQSHDPVPTVEEGESEAPRPVQKRVPCLQILVAVLIALPFLFTLHKIQHYSTSALILKRQPHTSVTCECTGKGPEAPVCAVSAWSASVQALAQRDPLISTCCRCETAAGTCPDVTLNVTACSASQGLAKAHFTLPVHKANSSIAVSLGDSQALTNPKNSLVATDLIATFASPSAGAGPDACDALLRKATLIYTLVGDPKFQDYIWVSIQQARLTNPAVDILVIIESNEYLDAQKALLDRMVQLHRVEVIGYRDLKTRHYLDPFRKHFFVAGNMVPRDGNQQFVRGTMERVIAVAEVARERQLSDVYHMENDNVLYVDLNKHLSVMDECNMDITTPTIDNGRAAVSLIYVRDPAAMGQMADFIIGLYIGLYKMGSAELTKLMGADVNDMTVMSRFFRTQTSTARGGLIQVMPSYPARPNEPPLCLWGKQKALYDAAALGQYFGGTHSSPDARWYEPQRPYVELNTKFLRWEECDFMPAGSHIHCPWIDDLRVVNLHIHSKNLQRFLSNLDKDKLPK